MALLDRFRAQPGQKHPNPVVRLAFVEEIPLDERDLLAEIAREDPDARVRRAAVGKVMDPAVLERIAGSDADEQVRNDASAMLRDVALDRFEGVTEAQSLAAVHAISDAKTLGGVAKAAEREVVAVHALSRIKEPHALGSIARHAQLESVRRMALDALDDRTEILAVAANSEFKDTAVAAVERLADRRDLEDIANRSKSRSAAKRARSIIREMNERAAAEAAAAAPPPAPVLGPVEVLPPPVSAPAEGAALAVERAAAADRERAEMAARQRDEDRAAQRGRQEQAEEEARQRRLERERREAEAKERDAQVRREALARLQQLLTRVEPLAAKADLPLKVGDRALRDIRKALADIPPLPSRHDYEGVSSRLKAADSALMPRVQELRDMAEWRRWANVGIQERLCQQMEGLASREDPEEIARQVRELQQRWREATDVPRAQGEVLWRRFKAAHDLAWQRCESHFAAQAELRAENLAKKIAFCERAESLADSTNWIQTAEEIKKLQADWKTIGQVPRRDERAIWERFRGACDRFFTRRHADLVERKRMWAESLARKEALCAKVEALADSSDWEAASAEIRRLQAEWKTVGPVKKSRSEAIWQRFRGACDHFFVRYSQRHDIARTERVTAREAICAELEALSKAGEDSAPQSLSESVRNIWRRWQQEIGSRGVDRERAAALDARFENAFATVLSTWPAAFAGTDLDPDSNRQRMEALVRRVEDLARSIASPEAAGDAAALSPTVRLAAMLKEALAANTIGGKVDHESRIRAAAEEVRQAQSTWSRIGPVAERQRRALADRFARACRVVTERAGKTGAY